MDLVHVPLDVCPGCHRCALAESLMAEPVLFRHGGYGATRVSLTLVCPGCNWSLLREVSELHPDPARIPAFAA